MADKPHNPRAHAWATAYSELSDLTHRLEHAHPHERHQLEHAVAAQQEQLLELPAPSLGALLMKLKLLFEADVQKPDQDGQEKRLVIEDLQDLIAENAELLGVR
jgi:hypothetical protein